MEIVEFPEKNGLSRFSILGFPDDFGEEPFEFDVVITFHLVRSGLAARMLSC